jgi:tetratricopeptide (TPR) repeat protein
MMKPLPFFRSLIVVLLAPALALFADTAAAHAALDHGRVDEAEKSLRATLAKAPPPPDAPYAHQLLCRVFYAQDQIDQAIPECEAAVAGAPNDSESLLWLGRAYGKKASKVNPLAAYALARKVRACFERAVQAQPNNVDAMGDLGEFYVAAPSIVGGGLDKARKLAESLEVHSPAQAHRLLAYIANSEKDTAQAEAEFKTAITFGRSPDAYVDLGEFYQHHGQLDQAVAAYQSGIDADRSHGPVLVEAATNLIAANRATDLAERALREYLSSRDQTDSAPVFKVHLQLGKLLSRRGDQAGAHREFAEAYALAPNFGPARDAVKGA